MNLREAQGYLTSRASSPTISRVSTFTGQADLDRYEERRVRPSVPAGLTATHAAWVTGDGIVAPHID